MEEALIGQINFINSLREEKNFMKKPADMILAYQTTLKR